MEEKLTAYLNRFTDLLKEAKTDCTEAEMRELTRALLVRAEREYGHYVPARECARRIFLDTLDHITALYQKKTAQAP